MNFDDLLKHTSEWLKGSGPNSNIVISSRIRLARNLAKLPFPHWAKKQEAEQVLVLAQSAFEKASFLKDTVYLRLDTMDNIDKQFLVERHLMSNEHAIRSNQKALLINSEEKIAIMVNEEDHFRLQVMESGFDLDRVWRVINTIDDQLSQNLSQSSGGNVLEGVAQVFTNPYPLVVGLCPMFGRRQGSFARTARTPESH